MASTINVDAPSSVWAGPDDARTFLEPAGMGWLAPLAGLLDNRVVDLNTLCSGPPPSNPSFTLGDVLATVPGSPGRDAAIEKMVAYTDRRLWESYCHFTDATPSPTSPPQVPPDGVPAVAPEDSTVKLIKEMHAWLDWMKSSYVPRTSYQGEPIRIEGTGDHSVPNSSRGAWPVACAGFVFGMDAPPEWSAHDGEGSGANWWDLGWFSVGNYGIYQSPIRIQHILQTFYPSSDPISSIAWLLPPGVAGYATPLYPQTTRHVE